MAGAGPSDSGAASGLANLTLQLGAALGLAVLASVSTSATARLLTQGTSIPSALTGGYHLAFFIGAGCVAAAVVLAWAMLPSRASSRPSTESRPSEAAV